MLADTPKCIREPVNMGRLGGTKGEVQRPPR
ncbi:MAG: hypothetical protein JWM63_4785 [Gammaproteobacteria bacterium]|nr:hypothetical protein [Gammaproteobacteria bacterium]